MMTLKTSLFLISINIRNFCFWNMYMYVCICFGQTRYSFPNIFFSHTSLYVSTFAHDPLCTDSSWRNMQILKNVNMTHCLTCNSCSLCKSQPSCDTLAFRRRLCAVRKLDAFSLAPLCTRPFCCPFFCTQET